MKKKTSVSKKATTPAKTKPDGLTSLFTEVRQLIQSARRGVSTVVDTFQVMTNFEIGRRIVEHEQKGAKRAAYGAELLKELSARLTEEFGSGFSHRNLDYMRKFYLVWNERVRISQQPIAKSGPEAISQQPVAKSKVAQISQTASGELAILQQPTEKLISPQIRQQAIGKFPFTLSWTHYLVLLTIKDPDERSFYEIEATNAGWSVPELKRQKASCLYERLALTRIIAKLNGWMPFEHEQVPFIASLWQELRAAPSMAFQAECPIRHESLPKNKTHRQVAELLHTYGQVLHEDAELGYSLRQIEGGDETIIALQVPGWGDWRMMRLSLSDKQRLDSGELPAEHIFHRYSSRGALVAYPSQVVFNANSIENKFAAKALRKREKAITAKRESQLACKGENQSKGVSSP